MINRANHNMLIGGGILFVGALFTIISYSLVASSPSGGYFIVARGAIFFGAVQFLFGLGQLLIGPIVGRLPQTAPEPQAAKWQVAVDHYPDLVDIELKLRPISDKLAAEFRTKLLESKKFSDRHKIAEQLERDFLTASFGRNSEILRFGHELLVSGNKEAARELVQTIEVLGDTTDPNLIIDRIQKKFLHEQAKVEKNDLREVGREDQPDQIAKRLLKTEYVSDALALIQAMRGEFSKVKLPGLFARNVLVLHLHLRGKAKRFNTEFEMTQWLIKEIVPTVITGAKS